MSHLVRASAALAVLALAVPGGAAAKAAKPKHTTTVRTVTVLPKTTAKNLSRKCGKSHSATKIRSRRTSRPTKQRIRTITTYCNGGTRTSFIIRRSTVTKTVTVPAPVVTSPAPRPVSRSFRLTLLHNNDGESKYVVGDSIANYGGITRFKTVLERLRADAAAYTNFAESAGAEDKGTVTISSGDNYLAGLNLRASFQRYDATGTPWYDSQAINAIGYDATTIGNHEYDFGPERLAQFVTGANTTQFLTANTDFSAEPSLQALRNAGRIANSVVVEKAGQKIGIIGISPPETPSISSPRRVTFLDADQTAAAVNAEAGKLTAAGVNKIILSSHLQNSANEKALVGKISNVDIVISGGADDLQANESDTLLPNTTATFPYPRLVKDSAGKSVPMVTTQGEYRYVGRLTVTFDPNGNIESTDASRSGPVRVTADPAQPDYVAEDPTLKATITDPLVAYKASLAANKIGTTNVLLDGGNPNPVRVKESNLGNLVADGFLAAANRTATADGRPLAKVAFSNGGGIRTSIAGPEAGKATADITEKSTFDVLPFDNVIVTVPGVTPAKFKQLMEWGVAARTTNENVGDGRFPQISGYRITVDLTKPAQVQTGTTITTPGQRITSLTLDDGTKIVENGALVAGAPNVNLATTNFTATNGDNYPFNGLPQVAAGVPYQQSLYDYIVQDLGGVVSSTKYPAAGSGRIVITP
jgi:5'-nucleotidase/UDP-sugar diphosphatase